MAYVAVTGGQDAIDASIRLLQSYRTRGEKDIDIAAIGERMSLLIDKIMSEAGLYMREYAALALKQSEGSPEEAVFLLRAYRSTLPRGYYSLPMDGADMRLLRRISSAFKDVPGGQILGPTYDYTHRLLDFSLLQEDTDKAETALDPADEIRAARVLDILSAEGLMHREDDDTEPFDITQNPMSFPAPRSARLQAIARAEGGYVSGLAYAGIRGFGPAHPTVGELRTGYVEVCIRHPLYPGQEIVAGEILATEVTSFFSQEDETGKETDPVKLLQAGQGDKADTSTSALKLGCGYGMVFGRSDNKAIAMSILDYMLDTEGDSILQDHEFVLLHGDCLEMSGFISHLKLPHYVTFQSRLDRVRHTQGGENNGHKL
jgi:alpha-D-ribose 1-methylphosphonate 5-triphosphate synthase subunit PhnI